MDDLKYKLNTLIELCKKTQTTGETFKYLVLAFNRIEELEQRLAEAEAKISEWEAAPDFVKAGDGTLHGAIDYWQERAAKAEANLAETENGLRWVCDIYIVDDSYTGDLRAERLERAVRYAMKKGRLEETSGKGE